MSSHLSIDFSLPEHLIATHPSADRDNCKLLVYNRHTEKIQHAVFREIYSFLSADHFLVLNKTQVLPRRTYWKDDRNKPQELVLLKLIEDSAKTSIWEAIVSGKKLKSNHAYDLHQGITFKLVKDRSETLAVVELNCSSSKIENLL